MAFGLDHRAVVVLTLIEHDERIGPWPDAQVRQRYAPAGGSGFLPIDVILHEVLVDAVLRIVVAWPVAGRLRAKLGSFVFWLVGELFGGDRRIDSQHASSKQARDRPAGWIVEHAVPTGLRRHHAFGAVRARSGDAEKALVLVPSVMEVRAAGHRALQHRITTDPNQGEAEPKKRWDAPGRERSDRVTAQ